MTRNFGVHAQKKRVQPRKTLNTATQRKYGSGLPTTMNDLPSMRNGGERQVRSDARGRNRRPAEQGGISADKMINNAMSAIGPKRTSLVASHISAFGGKADMTFAPRNVCF